MRNFPEFAEICGKKRAMLQNFVEKRTILQKKRGSAECNNLATEKSKTYKKRKTCEKKKDARETTTYEKRKTYEKNKTYEKSKTYEKKDVRDKKRRTNVYIIIVYVEGTNKYPNRL